MISRAWRGDDRRVARGWAEGVAHPWASSARTIQGWSRENWRSRSQMQPMRATRAKCPTRAPRVFYVPEFGDCHMTPERDRKSHDLVLAAKIPRLLALRPARVAHRWATCAEAAPTSFQGPSTARCSTRRSRAGTRACPARAVRRRSAAARSRAARGRLGPPRRSDRGG